jgi:putative ABC transport system permease protein
MIRQLFSMLWRQKKGNFLLVFQLFVSFLALTLFIALNIEKFSDYFKPYSFNYKNILGVSIRLDSIPQEEAQQYLRLAKLKLQAIPEIQKVSSTSLIPFWDYGTREKLSIDGQEISSRGFSVDENYLEVIGVPILKGRWFNSKDYNSPLTPIIITDELAKTYFKDQDPIGRTILIKEKKARIIGVTQYRDQNTNNMGPDFRGCIFKLLAKEEFANEFLLKSNRADDFLLLEEKIRKELSTIKDERFVMRTSAPLTLLKKMSTKNDLIQLTLALMIFGFLVLNVFLGISGVFSYSISKRRAEIGLRVAAGASSGSVVKQFLSETVVLASFAVIPGIIIATQFFITGFFRWITFWQGFAGIAGASLFIYLLMISCCIYPALRASKIHPAEALHEE